MHDEYQKLENDLIDTVRYFKSDSKLQDRAFKNAYTILIYRQMDTINLAISRLQSLVNSWELCDGMDDINELPGFCDNYPFKHSLDEMDTMWGDMNDEQRKEYNANKFMELKQRRRALGDRKYIPDSEIVEEPESEDYRRGFKDGEERAREHYTGEVRD